VFVCPPKIGSALPRVDAIFDGLPLPSCCCCCCLLHLDYCIVVVVVVVVDRSNIVAAELAVVAVGPGDVPPVVRGPHRVNSVAAL